MCFPDRGHVIPTLAVVAELTRRGNRVTYLTGGSAAEAVAAAGAEVVTYDSPYERVRSRAAEDDPLALLSLLLDESEAMLAAAARLLVRPDAIAYDISTLHAGRVLARATGLPATQLIPIFASNAHYSVLAATYEGEAAGRLDRELPGWVDGMLARIGALARRHGVHDDPAALWWGVQDSNLVALPRSFQYAGETFDERFTFVGPCLGERRFLEEWRPPGDGLPVALLSFGSVGTTRPELLRTCAQALAELPWRTVVTLADGTDPAVLGPLPPTVEPRRRVSHLSVLRHASVAVTHGGLGTAMEALHRGCPLVVVPTTAMDGPVARRVAELGLGRALDPAGLTAAEVAERVLAVAADPAARRAAAAMSADIRASGGAARAADLLERLPSRAAA
ncbi:Oleandomycin glycosyltransferase [Nonomuraea coxensis DSM 45129]|uniref:Oleandomycin glycosyltransferase n=1 Tax=Nonomuraea coxensis DSM 45129 TaxID=1122611 RepID=A0ABX8U7S8_9ACTN|nr:macrolide family glycosyltransferase [Nonomuraea coxensis]QYC42717.1 Oleandomycin glycosyltransferase [Nonomuraea coxensis DSM 45129]